jgi:hypothetical protein
MTDPMVMLSSREAARHLWVRAAKTIDLAGEIEQIRSERV